MIVLRETTKWDSPTPNHIYLVDDYKNRLFAYVNVLTGEVKKFSKPLQFDPRHRTFKTLRKI